MLRCECACPLVPCCRVRTLRSQPSLPVESEHQATFAQLLHTIFAELPQLVSAQGDLAWAAQVAEDGTAWEPRLRPMGQLVALCSECVVAMQRGQEAAEELAAQAAQAGGA